MPSAIQRVIVGTAGHIDHGKSTLVRVLTGIDPDRLKEEQERGMTIDLGFAPYRTRAGRTVGIIDVPGHERFVKNMVAGATSVDVFVLVIAADDGVMPQTREHVEILDLLGAERGLVAVTKIDAVDTARRAGVVAEISDYLRDTPFSLAPIVPCSSTTGEGIDALRERLDALIDETVVADADGLFRMPIQRVFSAHGHGTVVTGVPVSGHVAIGDVLEILPSGAKGRVRSIQAYKEDRTDASAGHSTALVISDVDADQVRRGHVVATPGYFRAESMFEARLRLLASAAAPLEHAAEVRVHVGTTESLARVAVLDRPALEPGGEALVQLRLYEPVVASRGDRFLIRRPSPAVTLGGGTLVSSSERRLGRMRDDVVETVRSRAAAVDDADLFLEEVLRERGLSPLSAADAPRILKCTPSAATATLGRLASAGRIVGAGKDRWLATAVRDAAAGLVCERLRAFHDAEPMLAWADAAPIRAALGADDATFEAIARHLEQVGRVEIEKGGRLRERGRAPRLAPEEERVRAILVAELSRTPFAPPSLADLARAAGASASTVERLLGLLLQTREVVRAQDIWFTSAAIARATEIIGGLAKKRNGEIVVPEVRDALGTTRKYLIPLLEYLDSASVTVRRGDKRYFVARSAASDAARPASGSGS